MKPLFTILALTLLFGISGFSQIQNFYNYVDQNLEGYDSAGFFFIKKPNTIPPGAFFDIYVAASGDMDNAIALKKTWTDNQLGMTHYRYQQTYKGVTVEVGEATEHYDGNELDYVNGKLVYNLNRSVTPDITPAQAIANVQAYFAPSFDGGGNDSSNNEALNVQIVGTPELLLAIDNYKNLSVYIDGSRYTLAWKVIANDTTADYNSALFVNANTGIVFREDNLNHYGSADIWYHGNQYIDT
jgi:Zn-dependent metalloprotease